MAKKVWTEVTICNMALDAIGAKTISDNVLDLTLASVSDAKELRECGAAFGPAVEELCNDKHEWEFCRRHDGPLAVDLAPAPANDEFTYAYTLPTDCLSVRKITDSDSGIGDDVDFSTNYSHLYTDAQDVSIRYTALVQNYSYWPPHMILVLWNLVAWRIAKPLTGKEVIAKERERLYMIAKAQAKLKDVKIRRDPRAEPDYYWRRGFDRSTMVR